jgi:hypothetical protein
MFEMSHGSSAPPAKPDVKMLIVPAAIGLAIAAAATFYGSLDTAFDRAPIAIVGGASFALGGLLGWAIRRWRAR